VARSTDGLEEEMTKASTRFAPGALLAAIIVLLALPAPVFAGRIVATGHDADSHCSGYDAPSGQCHFVAVAVNYVRGGAPTPNRPLLLLDCSTPSRIQTALNNAGLGSITGNQVICPSANVAAFNATAFTTSSYSAILVGSSGDQTSVADSAALNARSGDIASFFNAGGGILAFAGDFNGDDPADPYYQFVPIGIGGKQVAPSFRLTPEGQGLGFQDSVNGIGTNDDINCCPTHNSFQEPAAGSALQVAERDSSVPPAPETLFAEGTISGGTIKKKPSAGSVIKLPSNKKCVSRRKFRIRIRQPGGIKIQTALVFVNGKKVKVLKRKVFRRKRHTAGVNLRGLPRGTFKVRIVVLTTDGNTLRGTRKYRTCTKKRRSKRPPKL
jgi:hypothetical protein